MQRQQQVQYYVLGTWTVRASLSTPAAVLLHGGAAVQSAEALSEGESISEGVVINK